MYLSAFKKKQRTSKNICGKCCHPEEMTYFSQILLSVKNELNQDSTGNVM